MSEWISVKDRLPEYDGSRDSGGAASYEVLLVVWGAVRQGMAFAYKNGECVFTVPNVSGETTQHITHWQHLPEPPK